MLGVITVKHGGVASAQKRAIRVLIANTNTSSRFGNGVGRCCLFFALATTKRTCVAPEPSAMKQQTAGTNMHVLTATH